MRLTNRRAPHAALCSQSIFKHTALFACCCELSKQFLALQALPGQLDAPRPHRSACSAGTNCPRPLTYCAQALLRQLDAEREAKAALERELRLLQEAGKQAEQAAAAEAADKVGRGGGAWWGVISDWFGASSSACWRASLPLGCMLLLPRGSNFCPAHTRAMSKVVPCPLPACPPSPPGCCCAGGAAHGRGCGGTGPLARGIPAHGPRSRACCGAGSGSRGICRGRHRRRGAGAAGCCRGPGGRCGGAAGDVAQVAAWRVCWAAI